MNSVWCEGKGRGGCELPIFQHLALHLALQPVRHIGKLGASAEHGGRAEA